jgi:hypothetical protein
VCERSEQGEKAKSKRRVEVRRGGEGEKDWTILHSGLHSSSRDSKGVG